MAKGNALMGTLQGRVGDMLFKVRKGQQISGKLQKQVINTRTTAQMKQRTQLNNLVACYRVLKPAIEMGFENKASNQSNYNAFVGKNMNVGTLVFNDKDSVKAGVTIVAPYQITSGTLSPVVMQGAAPNAITNIALGALAIGPTTTIGQFSSAILANNPQIVSGMQLSYISMVQRVDTEVIPPASIALIPRAYVEKYEITLNVENAALLSDSFPARALGVTDGFLSHVADSLLGGYTWVWSQKVGTLIKVSSQRLNVTSLSTLADYVGSAAQTRAGSSYNAVNGAFLDPNTGAPVIPAVPVPSVTSFKTSGGLAVANQVQAGQSFNLAGAKIEGNNLDIVTSFRIYAKIGVDPMPSAETMISESVPAAASAVTPISATLAGPSASGLYNAVAIICDGVVVWQTYIFPDEEGG